MRAPRLQNATRRRAIRSPSGQPLRPVRRSEQPSQSPEVGGPLSRSAKYQAIMRTVGQVLCEQWGLQPDWVRMQPIESKGNKESHIYAYLPPNVLGHFFPDAASGPIIATHAEIIQACQTATAVHVTPDVHGVIQQVSVLKGETILAKLPEAVLFPICTPTPGHPDKLTLHSLAVGYHIKPKFCRTQMALAPAHLQLFMRSFATQAIQDQFETVRDAIQENLVHSTHLAEQTQDGFRIITFTPFDAGVHEYPRPFDQHIVGIFGRYLEGLRERIRAPQNEGQGPLLDLHIHTFTQMFTEDVTDMGTVNHGFVIGIEVSSFPLPQGDQVMFDRASVSLANNMIRRQG